MEPLDLPDLLVPRISRSVDWTPSMIKVTSESARHLLLQGFTSMELP